MFDDFDQIQVHLSEGVIVGGSHYRLSEVAHLEGTDPALLEKLSNLKIGRSPLPGGSLVVTKSLILSRLRAHVKKRNVTFPDLERVTIRRSALRVSGDDIDQVVLNHIEEQLAEKDTKIKLMTKSRDIFLPKGDLDFEVKARGKYKQAGGYQTYEVFFKIDHKIVKKVPVRTHIKIYKEVFVAKDTIKRDHMIQDSDLEKIRTNVGRLPKNYVTDKSLLVGKVAKRAIGPSEVMHDNAVATPPLVKSGDQLLIVYETPSLRLTAPGIAMRRGRLGERITVRNLNSKSIVQAIVKEKNMVQVY